MNKKVKNSSGFTLVELIVVMTLMGIIMGAVLNFIQPTAELYKNTNTYLSEEEATTTIYNALQDDLMYATALYVYTSDNGNIDEVVDEIVDSGENLLATPYTNCLVLSNVDDRLNGTDAAVTKGATGTVTKYALYGGKYVDVSTGGGALLSGQNLYLNSFSMIDQSFMDDASYIFGVSHASGTSSLTVTIDVYEPVYSSSRGSYVFREVSYSALKSIEIINNTVNKMTSSPNFGSPSVTDQDDPTPYIYIFYGRKAKIQSDAPNINYEVYLMDHDGVYQSVGSGGGPEGADVYADVFAAVENYNIARVEAGGYVYQSKNVFSFAIAVDNYDENEVYYDLHNLTGYGATSIQLYMVYEKTAIGDMPQQYINFFHSVTADVPDFSYQVDYGDDFILGDHPELSLPEPQIDGQIRTSTIWANKDSLEEFINYSHVTNTINAYKLTYEEYLITFVDMYGNPIPWTMSDGTDGTNGYWLREGAYVTEYPNLDELAADEGMYWIWDESNQGFDEPIGNMPVEFIARQEYLPEEPEEPEEPETEEPEDPPGGGGGGLGDITAQSPSSVNTQVQGDGIWNPYSMWFNSGFTLTNNSGFSLTGGTITVTLTFSTDVTIAGNANVWHNAVEGSVTTSLIGSNVVEIKIPLRTSANSWEMFENGSQITVQSLGVYIADASAYLVSISASYSN